MNEAIFLVIDDVPAEGYWVSSRAQALQHLPALQEFGRQAAAARGEEVTSGGYAITFYRHIRECQGTGCPDYLGLQEGCTAEELPLH